MISTREVILLGLVDAVRTAYTDPVDEEVLDGVLASLFSYAQHLRRDEQVPDPMPPGWNRPAPANGAQVVLVLGDCLEAVEQGDSWEGFVQWSIPTDEPELEGAEFGLIARYRIGNLTGQGGMRVYHPPLRRQE